MQVGAPALLLDRFLTIRGANRVENKSETSGRSTTVRREAAKREALEARNYFLNFSLVTFFISMTKKVT